MISYMFTCMTMTPTGIGGGNHAKITRYRCTIFVISNSLDQNLSVVTVIFSWQMCPWSLSHYGLNKMANNMQATFSNTSWNENQCIFNEICSLRSSGEVSIDSGNGVLPNGTKPLSEPVLTDVCHHMVSLGCSRLFITWEQHVISQDLHWWTHKPFHHKHDKLFID